MSYFLSGSGNLFSDIREILSRVVATSEADHPEGLERHRVHLAPQSNIYVIGVLPRRNDARRPPAARQRRELRAAALEAAFGLDTNKLLESTRFFFLR